MRVGIYNRWLATLGGGEKYALTVAEYLSRRHSVEVITHKPVSKELAAQRLNIDLSRVQFVNVPDRPSIELAPLTADYDFFICASFLDLLPTRAPRSAMIVFFPMPLGVESKLRFRRRVGLVIKRSMMVPSFSDGVLNTDAIDGKLQRQTSGRVTIKLPPARQAYAVHFDVASSDALVRRAQISIDDRVAETLDLAFNGKSAHCRVVVPASRRAVRTLTIHSESDAEPCGVSPVKMVLTHFEIEHPSYRLYRILFERWLKNWGLKLYRIPSNVTPFLERINSYDELWAISKFSQSWIKRYWNLPSQILYPPIDVRDLRPSRKQNRILSVGRFFVGSHNKKHREMVAAFKQMVDAGLVDWELHLAGGVNSGEENLRYLQTIADESRGYSITIHPDLSREDLMHLYASSAIYWHACGYGEDEEKEPIKFEHFGITTVEAMAAGCVPIVINKGGQREIVRHGQNGLLWQTTAELKEQTFRLTLDDSLRARLAAAAISDSRIYDKAHFDLRLQKLLGAMGVD